MIRHILLIPAILLSVIIANAQSKGVKYNIGPKVGINVFKSRFNFKEDEDVFDQRVKYGIQLGGAYDMPLKKNIHYYMELYYSMKGKKTIVTATGLVNDARYNFLEMPVMVRFSFEGAKVSSGVYNWHFGIGPTASYWFGGRGKLYGADGPTQKYVIIWGEPPVNNSEFDKMYISNPSRLQWGLVVGAGIDYPVYGQQNVYLDFRVQLGGTNLGDYDSVANIPILGFAESMDVRFLEFNLSAVYTFEVDWLKTKKGKSTAKRRKKS
ncbi:MAG: porin family protein [Bacteroidota bacterium]